MGRSGLEVVQSERGAVDRVIAIIDDAVGDLSESPAYP